jgi:hypothetical protein
VPQKAFGVETDTGELIFLMRVAGAEILGLGAHLLSTGPGQVERSLTIAAAVDGLSCLLAIAAGLSGSLSKRSAFMLAITTGSLQPSRRSPSSGTTKSSGPIR